MFYHLFVCLFFVVTLPCLKVTIEYFERKRKRFQNLPSGPKGIPIIGNLHQLGRKPHLTLFKFAKNFPRFFTLDILGAPVVVINDTDTMKELFGKQESTGKFKSIVVDIIHGADYGIVNTEGEVWKSQHTFFVKVLRQFGFRGGNQLVPKIISECETLCDLIDTEMKSSKTESLKLDKLLLHSVATIVWNAVTGERHSTKKNKIVDLLDELTTRANNAIVLVLMPWLRLIVPEKTGWNQLVKTGDEYHSHVNNYFENRKVARKFNNDSVPLNVIDAYIDKVETCRDTLSTFYGKHGMKHARFAVGNLLLGGSETTSSIIKWLIHYLIVYPKVQKKLQMEIDQVVQEEGNNLAEIDTNRLPYLNAVIQEVLRITTLTPLGNVQKLLDDVTYEGYILPKGTYLLANIYSAHMNTDVWQDPDTFRPERFLEGTDAERNTLKGNMVAFQVGRRKCPGDQAAYLMIYFYALKLFKKYSFYKEENRSAEEYLEPCSGFLLLPPHLPVGVKARKD